MTDFEEHSHEEAEHASISTPRTTRKASNEDARLGTWLRARTRPQPSGAGT